MLPRSGEIHVSVNKVAQRFGHGGPETALRASGPAVLAQDPKQREHQQADAVLVLRVRLRRAHRTQARQPSGQQLSLTGWPAFRAGPPVTFPSPTCSRPVATATHQGRCNARTSAIVRTRGGTSTPSAAPAAATSALRSTCPAVTGRGLVPIHWPSATARPMTMHSRARRAASRRSSPEAITSTAAPYRHGPRLPA